MKIALAQLNYHIGNFDANVDKIITAVEQAKEQQAELVVFSELAICGYPPRDFLQFEDFLNRCEKSIQALCEVAFDIGIIVGAPSRNTNTEGKGLFNSAYLLVEGKIQSIHSKALLPTYDVFDEYRYFEPSSELHIAEFKNLKIGLTICEDLWDVGNDKQYTIDPMRELQHQGAELMINIAASPFSYDHLETRQAVLERNIDLYSIPLLYVNHVGAQTELIFDGGSMVYNKDGELHTQLNTFGEDLVVIDTEDLSSKHRSQPDQLKIERIHKALVLGVRDYFKKLNFKSAVIGLSGGIDSAVTLAIVSEALGPENTLAVMLPSQFSSDHSVDDSIEMVQTIGCMSEKIEIGGAYESIFNSMPQDFQESEFGIAEENIQARIRAIKLMALANKYNHILLNTSNKSEAAVGYGTLYGDMSGGLSVLGDLYKTEVYELAEYINSIKTTIPQNIIDKAPSAELRPDQKDSDSLPDYAVLDKILFHYIEEMKGPQEIIELGFSKELVDKTIKLVNMNEFKRAQTPPVLRVSNKAFGMGRRMPIVGKYLS